MADSSDPIEEAARKIVADNQAARNASSDRIARLTDALASDDEKELSDVVEDILNEATEDLRRTESEEGSTGVDGPEAESTE